jgi:PAS domain S-box-containing protein
MQMKYTLDGERNEYALLKERYDHIRSVLDDMISGVLVVDRRGTVLLMNKMVTRHLGRPEADCIGRSIETLFPKMADVILQRVRAVFASGRPTTHENRIRAGEETRWLFSAYQPVFDERQEIHAVQILSLDVTEQKRTQEDLLHTKRLLDKSQQVAKIGHWEWRLRDDRITWSDGYRRMYGFGPDEAISVETSIGMIHPDDYARWEEELKQSYDEKRPFFLDYRIVRRDQSVVWINAQTELRYNAEGKLSKVWGVLQDITERVEAEQKRIELESRLRQSQKMEAIGTLAGGIAHDFNNILSAIIGYTELALEDVPAQTLTHQNLHEVLRAGLRAKELVRHILTFSRQTEIQRQPMAVSAIVKETARMLRATIPAFIALKIEDLSKNSTILGDASQIHQVILNLCTNAAHAMEEEGGTLLIRLENLVIHQEDTPLMPENVVGACLKLSVSDTGVGIAPELIDRIFEPYMTTKPAGKGTGLGLSVVHGIVQSHCGCISVRSRPHEGTTMEIILPLIGKEMEAQKLPAATVCTGNEHILLVDDEQQIVHFQKQALERLGYTVTARTSSIEAMEAFRAHPDRYQAVVTDMTMPNLTGDLLAKEMKSLRPDIPVIICTGYSEKLSESRVKMLGIDLFLMKPVGRMDLANALRQLLDKQNPSLSAD